MAYFKTLFFEESLLSLNPRCDPQSRTEATKAACHLLVWACRLLTSTEHSLELCSRAGAGPGPGLFLLFKVPSLLQGEMMGEA
jgi:hypothetical protein